MYKIIINIILTFTLTSCGNSSSKKILSDENEILLDKKSKKYFGILANATVNIYELGDGKKKLLFTENTSTGQSIEEIGNFNPHFDDLERNKYYLFEIMGGENMDADKDGVIDEIATTNTAVYSAIYKGYKIHIGYRNLKKRATKTSFGEE